MEVEHETMICLPYIKDALCSASLLRLIQYQLKVAWITESKLVCILTMHPLALLKWVNPVSNGLHCIYIAFQFTWNGSVISKNDSVKPEKLRSSNYISVFHQGKYLTCWILGVAKENTGKKSLCCKNSIPFVFACPNRIYYGRSKKQKKITGSNWPEEPLESLDFQRDWAEVELIWF